MKLVFTGGSPAGGSIPAALPAAMHLRSQAMLQPRVRMTDRPSSSCRTSSGVLPWTMFQYREDTTGIWLMVKYFWSWSRAAVVPPRRELCPGGGKALRGYTAL